MTFDDFWRPAAMSFDEYVAWHGFRQIEDGRFMAPYGESFLDAADVLKLKQMYYGTDYQDTSQPLYGTGGQTDGIVVDGTPYQQIGPWANNSADPATALQMEIDHLKQYGVEPTYDPTYGWIAPDVSVDPRVAQAHPQQNSDSFFDFLPIMIPLLMVGAGAFAGAGELAGGGALAGATEGGITAADVAATAAADDLASGVLATQSAADAGIGLNSGILQTLQDLGIPVTDSLVQSIAKQAVGGAVQSGVQGGDPLEGALMGGALGGL